MTLSNGSPDSSPAPGRRTADDPQLTRIVFSIDSLVESVNAAAVASREKIEKFRSLEQRLIRCYNDPVLQKTMAAELAHAFEVLYKAIIRTYETLIHELESRNEIVHSDIKVALANYQRELVIQLRQMHRGPGQ